MVKRELTLAEIYFHYAEYSVWRYYFIVLQIAYKTTSKNKHLLIIGEIEANFPYHCHL